MKIYLSYILLTFFLLFFTACGDTQPKIPDVPTVPLVEAPKEFDFRVEIENYKIIKARNDDLIYTLGKIRWLEKYVEFNVVYLTLKAEKFPRKIWIVELPKKNGRHTLTAELYNEDLSAKDLSKAPKSLTITITIKNTEIIKHSIKDIHPLFGKFRVLEKDRYDNIIYFQNNKYQPQRDTIICRLQYQKELILLLR